MNALRAALNFLLFNCFIMEKYYTKSRSTADAGHCRLRRGRNRQGQVFCRYATVWCSVYGKHLWNWGCGCLWTQQPYLPFLGHYEQKPRTLNQCSTWLAAVVLRGCYWQLWTAVYNSALFLMSASNVTTKIEYLEEVMGEVSIFFAQVKSLSLSKKGNYYFYSLLLGCCFSFQSS